MQNNYLTQTSIYLTICWGLVWKIIQTYCFCKVLGWPTTSAWILKCSFNGHFTIPWGHRRRFMNDSDTTQLTLVGHMIVTKWLKQNVQFHSFYTHSYYINGHKVSSNSNVVSIQTVRYFGRTAIYSMLYFNLFICLSNIFVPLTCNMNQIKSNQNQITFIVTSPQHKCLGEWNSYERAPDSAKNKIQNKTTIYIWTVHIYRLYRRQCAKYTYIYSVHTVYY